MATPKIITIGGSAGSLDALKTVIKNLPADLSATVFVVIHLSPRAESSLAKILGSISRLPALPAREGQRIDVGKIYVAVPDRHLLIAANHLHVTRGPKEGLHRPSINVTFRSAAAAYGNRVIGVLLSGMLDDGASGLWEITKRNGVAIVQDPEEAAFQSMPMSALQDVPTSRVSKVNQIAPLLTELVSGSEVPQMPDELAASGNGRERFSGLTCPECRGPLYELRGKPAEFRCRVGHQFPLKTLLDEETSTQERKLYEAIVALEEGADLAEYAGDRADPGEQGRFIREARQLREQAASVRRLIEERASPVVHE